MSQQAINFPNTIRVYMNYRQADQRGIVYPRPTSLNNAMGLMELLLDQRRERLYITNAGFNRLEIFDTRLQRFLEPLEVGQLPRSMAMSLDGRTLYVGNTGGESISIVDLDSLTVSGNVEFPPIPRAGNSLPVQPYALAMSLRGLQFMMSNGTFWRVVGNQATPRLADAILPTTGTIGAVPQYMIATPSGEYMMTVSNNGTAYLYDALADTYTASRLLYDQPPISYFAPLTAAPNANFFVVSGMTLSSGLSLIGGAERPGTTQLAPPPAPGFPPIQTIVSAGQRNVAAAYAIDENRFVRLTTPVRQNITTTNIRDDLRPTLELVDTRTGAASVAAVAPENPVQSVFGTTRVNIPARQMAVDSNGTTYAITLSGLSVMPLGASGTFNRPQIAGGGRGIVSSTDGSPNFRPGSFVTINGSNLATAGTTTDLPLPTVLGGSCVVFNDVPIQLLQTSSGQISAQIPPEVSPGQNVVQVRSLMTAQSSDPLVVTVQRPE
jgi:DNA-binding beta-propeller fold protein YncE